MPALAARREQRSTNIWPGFVDALATLLMVIIFLLMIFVLAQFFLTQEISGQDEALRKLKIEVTDLTNILALERKTNTSLLQDLTQISAELQASVQNQDSLSQKLNALEQKSLETTTNLRRALKTIMNQEIALKESVRVANDRATSMLKNKVQVKELKKDIDLLRALRSSLIKEANELQVQLKLAKNNNAELQQDLKKLSKERNTAQTNSKNSERLLIEEKQISAHARAQMSLLNEQLMALRRQLDNLNKSLVTYENDIKEKDIQIFALGKRLNVALASKVKELNKYRSEFFGKLRELIDRTSGIRVVGDRFVFQSEVLFTKGSAELGLSGKEQLNRIGRILLDISIQIPKEIDWVLRVDGHTDSDPISTSLFPSNWELSTGRAISVVKHLIAAGLPPNRLIAAGFGEFSVLDTRKDEIAKRRNRRIELKLTQR